MSKNPEEIVEHLVSIGMDAESIASAVRRPVQEVRATIVTHERQVADEELRGEAREFARAAFKRARVYMEYGLPSQQMALIRTVLPPAMRALGAVEDKSNEETKAQLQVLFSEIRSVPGATKTIGEPIDVESTPASETTPNQDQEFGDPSV